MSFKKLKFKKPTIKTSKRMRKVKSRGTKLEETFAKLLRKNGVKYQSQPKLFGNPDFRIKGTKILIFCDSSFWHGRRQNEISGKAFKRNTDFWKAKLLYNKNRDRGITRELVKRDWVVLRFWDDKILKHPDSVIKKIDCYVKTSK